MSTDVLMLHTVGAAAEATVAGILVYALYRIRRNGEIPKGFVPIAVLISLGSLGRIIGTSLSWSEHAIPFWLNLTTLIVLLITILSVPIVLSAHYGSSGASATPDGSRIGLQWAMIGNIGAIIAGFLLVVVLHAETLLPLIASAGCIISAVLLGIQASHYRNLQMRTRGLLLFSGLAATGLVGISTNLLFTYRSNAALNTTFSNSTTSATLAEFCNVLVVLGLMFVFASVRLADIILKRVTGLYLWLGVSLLVWKVSTALCGETGQNTGAALLSIVVIAATLLLTPYTARRVNEWIDSWVFEVPDFDAEIHRFWKTLSSLVDRDAVYRAGEETLKDTLRLASARLLPAAEFPSRKELGAVGPNPRFLSPGSPLSNVISPSADVLLPVFHDGAPEYWIALSRGVMRPPWTATELSFVTRIAAEIQVRITTVLAEETRLERLRRESILREQIADAELRALRAQINPHFLFNSLNTIADLAVVAPNKAEEMTMRLASVFRYVLVNADRQFTSLGEEIKFARSYLGIEEARFENRLRVHFEVDPSLLQETIPALLLQPLVENSIKHGISPRREGGALTITGRRIPDGFELIVADDGVGLGFPAAQEPKPGAQVGVQNVKKRLETAYGNRATFALRPREGGGAEARIVFRTRKEEVHESTSC
ncbi:histidine kinase [Edaphobacter sp. HDX4]|uniref:sensor histidine kinase n=1 Tax=Edaphobacter sp. HDX4 TaxID=2794064 RepID=UPI002FE55925